MQPSSNTHVTRIVVVIVLVIILGGILYFFSDSIGLTPPKQKILTPEEKTAQLDALRSTSTQALTPAQQTAKEKSLDRLRAPDSGGSSSQTSSTETQEQKINMLDSLRAK